MTWKGNKMKVYQNTSIKRFFNPIWRTWELIKNKNTSQNPWSEQNKNKIQSKKNTISSSSYHINQHIDIWIQSLAYLPELNQTVKQYRWLPVFCTELHHPLLSTLHIKWFIFHNPIIQPSVNSVDFLKLI